MLQALRRGYRMIVPEVIRTSTLAQRAKRFVYIAVFSHDSIYDDHYYATSVEPAAARGAAAMARSITRDLHPRTAVDVGCGTGGLMKELNGRECSTLGLELSEAAIRRCQLRGLNVRRFDLETAVLASSPKYDVAVSMEVAEHLPERASDRFVDLLTSLSDVVVITAAPPGQGGEDHVNEQPMSYWIAKFRARDFVPDPGLAQAWGAEWRESGHVALWYHRNLMVFRRAGSSPPDAAPQNLHQTHP